MAAEHTEIDITFGTLPPTRRTQKKPYPDLLSSKESLVCPFYDRKPDEHAHCLGLHFSRHWDLEQYLARSHVFRSDCCNKPFASDVLRDKHIQNEFPCTPQEARRIEASAEKALKKDLRDNRKGQDHESKITSLYKRLFDDAPNGRMQFPFPPILLLIYYAITAIIFILLWSSLIILSRELPIQLSPKFIHELLMAFTSFDLQSVDPFIELMIEMSKAHSYKEGLNVSLQGMIRQLFRDSDTNLKDAMTHGTLPAAFQEMGGVLSSQVRKVLNDNPDQLALIRKYLKTVLQDNDHMFGQAYQGEPNAPETQHHTWGHDPAVITSLDTCPMDLDDSDPQCERGDVGMSNEMETSPPTAPDMRNDSLPYESQGITMTLKSGCLSGLISTLQGVQH
ncbi:hypothetical protein CFIMG_006395RAa [Ceratocystis fimbriata CBS 114723]|uniref:Uncharacterized protein n=1 Tax=Ceratocystis fimbriata CBS 114723 TaxID=1035309 RepID=A0A2C5WUS7_9PEZI|nr:hypothetical protein CFIMG_006395RAa [Ceratocystis fimbriata CBS 114723]